MKKTTFFLILIGISFNLLGQTENFKYISKNADLISDNLSSADSTYTFRSNRIESKEGFIDTNLLCASSSSACSIIFKIDKDNNWWVKFNDRWSLFFNSKNAQLQMVLVSKKSQTFIVPIFNKHLTAKDIPLACFVIRSHSSVYETDNNNLFWFHPRFGIVAVESAGFYYVRNDFTAFLTH